MKYYLSSKPHSIDGLSFDSFSQCLCAARQLSDKVLFINFEVTPSFPLFLCKVRNGNVVSPSVRVLRNDGIKERLDMLLVGAFFLNEVSNPQSKFLIVGFDTDTVEVYPCRKGCERTYSWNYICNYRLVSYLTLPL